MTKKIRVSFCCLQGRTLTATVGCEMKSGQLTLEDHSGCSVAKGLRVRMEAVRGGWWNPHEK